MKTLKNPIIPLILLAAFVFLNGAFAVIGAYQQNAHHRNWCQNWCLQIKPLWAETARAVASFGVSAATVIFIFAAAAAVGSAKALAVLFSIQPAIPRRFPAGNFFSPLFLALRRRRVQPLLFD